MLDKLWRLARFMLNKMLLVICYWLIVYRERLSISNNEQQITNNFELNVLGAIRVLIFKQGGHHGHFYTLSRHYKLQYQCDS